MSVKSQRIGSAPSVASWLRATNFHADYLEDELGVSQRRPNPDGIFVSNFIGGKATECIIIGGTITQGLIDKVNDQGWVIGTINELRDGMLPEVKGMIMIRTVGKSTKRGVNVANKVNVPDLI